MHSLYLQVVFCCSQIFSIQNFLQPNEVSWFTFIHFYIDFICHFFDLIFICVISSLRNYIISKYSSFILVSTNYCCILNFCTMFVKAARVNDGCIWLNREAVLNGWRTAGVSTVIRKFAEELLSNYRLIG